VRLSIVSNIKGAVITKEYLEVTIPYTENRTLFSSIVNQEFRITVALPFSYSSSDDNYLVFFSLMHLQHLEYSLKQVVLSVC